MDKPEDWDEEILRPVPENLLPNVTTTFTRYSLENLPLSDWVSPSHTPHQKAVFGVESGPCSQAIPTGSVPGLFENYRSYRVEHDVVLEYLVRIKGRVTDKVKRVIVFNMFVGETNSDLVWFQAQKKTAEAFMRRVVSAQLLQSGTRSDIKITRHELSIDRFVADIESGMLDEEIVSGWFINLRIPNLHTAFVDGNRVAQSTHWKQYTKSGRLASVDIVSNYAGDPIRTIITRNGTIVFRKRIGPSVTMALLDYWTNRLGPYLAKKRVSLSGAEPKDQDDDSDGTGDEGNDR